MGCFSSGDATTVLEVVVQDDKGYLGGNIDKKTTDIKYGIR